MVLKKILDLLWENKVKEKKNTNERKTIYIYMYI